MNETILHRKSQRSFREEELKEELIRKIQEEVSEVNAESALAIEFVEDGKYRLLRGKTPSFCGRTGIGHLLGGRNL